jgi:ABC-type glycerol-3-phosphate transport system substrate-binding protein
MKYLSPEILDSFRNPSDGKLYVLPEFTVRPDLVEELTVAVNNVLIIREDWLKKLNLSAPKTPDELYSVLKAFKTLPDINGQPVMPYSPLWVGNEINYHFGGMFGIHRYKNAVDDNEQRMIDYREKPEYLEYLKFSSKLFREGLINPEAYKMEWQQVYNDINPRGIVGLQSMWPNSISDINTQLQKVDPNAKMVPIPLPKAPGVEKSMIERINTLGTSAVIINKNFPDPERLFKFMDWQASNEGWASVVWGPPSKDNGSWYIDENGRLIDNFDVEKTKLAENPRWSADVLGGWAYGLYGVLKYTHNLVLDEFRPVNEMRALAKELYKDEIFIDNTYDRFMTLAPGPIRETKGTDLDKIFTETEARIIMTAKDDSDVEKMYQEMMVQANKAGFIDIMKEDYKRYMALK